MSARRLPVYLLLDCSHSMRGAPMEALRSSLAQLLADLRRDPAALETVCLSIITFATGAQVLLPLTEVLAAELPSFDAKGRSDLGAGLHLVIDRLKAEVRRSGDAQRGDWRPLVLIVSDGGPSDAWITPAKKLRAMHDQREVEVIAAGFDEHVHRDKLARITPHVLISTSKEPAAFSKLIRWVSVSLAASVRISPGASPVDAARLPAGFVLATAQPARASEAP